MSQRGSSTKAQARMQRAAGAAHGADVLGWMPPPRAAPRPSVVQHPSPQALSACRVEPPLRQRQTSSQVAGPYEIGLLHVAELIAAEQIAQLQASWMAADAAAVKALEVGMKILSVEVKGPGSGRETALRALQARGFKIISIKDTTPMPHNGTRPPKKRRV